MSTNHMITKAYTSLSVLNLVAVGSRGLFDKLGGDLMCHNKKSQFTLLGLAIVTSVLPKKTFTQKVT